MKKQLSLVLALVMILGSFSAVFAAEMPVTQVEKAEFLKTEGILKGNAKGELKLETDLKRRDALVVLSRLFNVEDEAKAYPSEKLTFTDLTDRNYNGYIAWALEKGYAKGKVDGVTFDLNGPLTTQSFATITLRALGYEENGTDIFKESYKTAKELGILEGVEIAEKDTVKRADMAAMTFNALGVKVKGTDKTLAETLNIKMPAPGKLTAEVKNPTENLKEVVLELSNAKLADEEKLEESNNYKLTGNVVERATLVGNDVVLLLKDALVKNREYELVVRNIDKDVNGKFKFKANDNSIPEVEKVEALGEYGIKVTTTEPINDARERNFLIDGKNVAMNIEQYGRDIILTPYYKASFSEKAEKLTIKELVDFAGYKSVEKDFTIEIVKDTVAPKVVDVISKGNKVEVIFDKDVYNDSIDAYYNRSSVGNISYEAGRQTVYATDAEKIDVNKVVYTFKDELTRRTNVTIVDVKNHSQVKMEKTTMEARVVLDYSEPEIIDKKVDTNHKDGTATITLYFDKDVKGTFVKGSDTKFKAEDHFTLYEREVYKRNEVEAKIDSVEYAKDRKDVIVVKLVDLTVYNPNNDLDYILEVINFTDATSLKNKMYRDYVDFKVSATSGFVVTDISEKSGRNRDTEITIKFNKAVDRNIAENLENYILVNNDGTRYDVKNLKGEIVAERNGKEVTIILPDSTFKLGSAKSEFGTLRIIDILKDKDGNRLAKEYVHTFGQIFAGVVENAKEAELNAIALIPTTGTLTANEKALETAKNELVALKDSKTGYTFVNYTKLVDAIEKVEKAIEKVEKDNTADDSAAKLAAKRELNAEIKIAEAHYKTLTENTEGKRALAVAISTSKSVHADDKTTTVALNAQIKALKDAVAATKVLNTVELEKAKDVAKAKVEAEYTTESFAELTVALALPETTQVEIDAKVAAINAAIVGLEKIKDEEVTATFGATLNPITKQYTAYVILSDQTKNDKVTKFIVDGKDFGVGAVVGNKVAVLEQVNEVPETVVVIVDGKPITATK